MSFSCSLGLRPWGNDPSDYSVEVQGTIMLSADDEDDPDALVDAGKIELTIIKVAEVAEDPTMMMYVFDDCALNELYAALYNEAGLRKDLETNAVPGDIVFIESIQLDPKYLRTSLFVQAVETTIAAFASMGLVAASKGTLDRGNQEWDQMGFVLIPGTDFVFRDNQSFESNRYDF